MLTVPVAVSPISTSGVECRIQAKNAIRDSAQKSVAQKFTISNVNKFRAFKIWEIKGN
jgi:hypothetical protein